MTRRIKLTPEERKTRERDRARKKRGWYFLDSPAPHDGKLHQALLPSVAETKPLIVRTLVPPEPKPRKPRQRKVVEVVTPDTKQPKLDF